MQPLFSQELTFVLGISILGIGIILGLSVFYFSSFLYFLFKHRVGSLNYAVKTLAIGLLTIPVAILITASVIVYILLRIVRGVHSTLRSFVKSQPVDKLDRSEPADTSEVTVYLVHGTFEPNAPWTLPGSPMRKAIEAIGHKVNLKRFSWSGANTPKARSEAALAFAEKIRTSPNSKNFIVAHSHGGNIIREMSHVCPDTAAKIHGVCLLSPPFIFRRKITRTAGNLILLNMIGFILAVQIPVALFLAPFGLYWPYGAYVFSFVRSYSSSQHGPVPGQSCA